MDHFKHVVQDKRSGLARRISEHVEAGDVAGAEDLLSQAAEFEQRLEGADLEFEIETIRAYAERLRLNAAHSGARDDGGASGFLAYAAGLERGLRAGRAGSDGVPVAFLN